MIVINILFLNANGVQAAGISDVITGGDSFIQSGGNESVSIHQKELQKASKTVFNILTIVGICAAVIIAALLGIKFMIGSVEEKAQVKDALVPFVIGCIVIFGAFTIWSIFVNLLNKF